MAKRLIERLEKIERQLHYDERSAQRLHEHLTAIDASLGVPTARFTAANHLDSLRETRRQLVQLKKDCIAGQVPQ